MAEARCIFGTWRAAEDCKKGADIGKGQYLILFQMLGVSLLVFQQLLNVPRHSIVTFLAHPIRFRRLALAMITMAVRHCFAHTFGHFGLEHSTLRRSIRCLKSCSRQWDNFIKNLRIQEVNPYLLFPKDLERAGKWSFYQMSCGGNCR
jgi:hypothetical protein